MKGHTAGGTMMMGNGSIYSSAGAQKLVAWSSTEAELIGVHDLMPQIVWTGYFLKAQGLEIVDSILYQDNMSAMLLEKNGRQSSTKQTRHINIRYFFVKDQVASGEVRIEHCPTKEMVADYFTKPLQGALFYKLWDYIMNIDPCSEYHSGHRSVLEDDVKQDSEDDVKQDSDSVTGPIPKFKSVDGKTVPLQKFKRVDGKTVTFVGRSYKEALTCKIK
jgi:hypothetical protein